MSVAASLNVYVSINPLPLLTMRIVTVFTMVRKGDVNDVPVAALESDVCCAAAIKSGGSSGYAGGGGSTGSAFAASTGRGGGGRSPVGTWRRSIRSLQGLASRTILN